MTRNDYWNGLNGPGIALEAAKGARLSDNEIREALAKALKSAEHPLRRVLLIPPDHTRLHSYAGPITAMLHSMLGPDCKVDVLPALGTHQPVTKPECDSLFGGEIRHEDLLVHNWREDVVRLGEVPGTYVKELSEGTMDQAIDVEINKRVVDPSYDLVISIGQVVPHEVVGMANYNKNLFVGCGGSSMISSSHMLGAFFGMERIMGRDHTPVRKLFDYAEEHFLRQVPVLYVLTVTTSEGHDVSVEGLYVGRDRGLFESAVLLSQGKNLIRVDKPLKNVVVFLDEDEFKSTWLGNKSIYRTRMAIADGGSLTVLAPGIVHFGEDEANDKLIRKYGYAGRERIIELFHANQDLRDNQSVPAHLIHGSSDGRFSITYATRHLTKEEIEGVHYAHMTYDKAIAKYDPARLRDGFNLIDGEEVFFISNPALGLWSSPDRFQTPG